MLLRGLLLILLPGLRQTPLNRNKLKVPRFFCAYFSGTMNKKQNLKFKKMKKLLFLSIVVFATIFSAQKAEAQNKLEAPSYIEAFYFAGDFNEAKYSGSYGFGFQANISDFNLGFSYRMRFNYGLGFISAAEGLTFDLGPQYTLCFTENFHLNIPLYVSMSLLGGIGGEEEQTAWGFNATPALQYHIGKVILKAGPTVSLSFNGGDPSYGFIAGLGFGF